MQARTSRFALLIALIVSLAACKDSDTSPSQPALNLDGTWTGTLFQPGGGTSGTGFAVTWTAAQTGSNVTGQHTMVHPVTKDSITGTLAGTVTSTQVTLTQTVGRGNVPNRPNCSFSGTGTMTATATSIQGALTTTFVNCEGFNMAPNGTVPAQLNLTK